jgi:DNA-binding NtrC family response regulator
LTNITDTVKVLIVDDENLDLFITKKLIGMEHQVEGFTSISEATAWSVSNSFDILLSDYYLGEGKHATDVLKAIKAKSTSDFKAFVLSNHIDDAQAKMLK